ncbi:hypothetical protein BDV96DRAFT_199463 [Lophiotrema nucula]|uniref:Uncharacterized protein n=1 Tax=Lophiotrema nucula TaxID=690887 RepID=A0A6A5YUG7_9PLEO|nr:hypothetical protein BDV96DRAFT_199463 [Lophiotrema nucula]
MYWAASKLAEATHVSGTPALTPTSSATPTPTPTASLNCVGLATSGTKYVARNTVRDAIDVYCQKFEYTRSIPGPGVGTYFLNTPETLEIGVTGGLFSDNGVPTPDDCRIRLYDLLDGCDTNEDGGNPMNWKAGGYTRIDGWNYTITPLHDRPQYPAQASAYCYYYGDCPSKKKWCEIQIWGLGWGSTDFGKNLSTAFENSQHLPGLLNRPPLSKSYPWDLTNFDTSFKYELNEKSRQNSQQFEWHVAFNTTTNLINGKYVVEHVPIIMKSAANLGDAPFDAKCDTIFPVS